MKLWQTMLVHEALKGIGGITKSKGKSIFDSQFIKGVEIRTHESISLFLQYHTDRRRIRASVRMNDYDPQ